VYPEVPPEAVTAAEPVLPPKQSTGDEVAVAVSAVGCVTVVIAVAVHPFASVTVTVYVPAVSELALALVPPVGVQA
jgi:hypothetical protein